MVWYHDGVWSAPPTQKISAPHEVTVSSMCDRWCYGMVVWQLLYESDNQSKPLGLGMVWYHTHTPHQSQHQFGFQADL